MLPAGNPARHPAILWLVLALVAMAPACDGGGADVDPGPHDIADPDRDPGRPGDDGVAGPDDVARDLPAGDPGADGPGADAGSDDTNGDPGAPDAGPPAPEIVVIPGSIDLGSLLCDGPVQRSLTVQNVGTATLRVTSVVVEDDPDAVFQVESGPFEVSPGSSRNLIVIATLPAGPASGYRGATLVLSSNDPIRPRVAVPLGYRPAEMPPCKAAFQPGALSIADPVDAPQDFTVNVVNIGTGNCDLEQVVVVDCPADGGDCPAPFEAASSRAFTLRGAPGDAPIRLEPGTTALLKLRFIPPWSGEPAPHRALLAARLRGADGCHASQSIDLPASPATPNVAMTAAPCVPPAPTGCPATACGDARPLADAAAAVAYLSGLEWNLDRPWCALGDEVVVAGPVEIDIATMPLPAFCDDVNDPCTHALRMWPAVPGITCLDEGEPLFCQRIRIQDARFRARASRMRIDGFAPSWLGVIDLLGPCDAPCAEGEVACPDHTCWPNAMLHCQGCLGGSDAVCGCRDEGGPLPDDTRCLWVSGDVIGSGWCRCGVCSTTYR